MQQIPVDFGARAYSILIDSGLLRAHPQTLQSWNHGQQWVMITQRSLYQRYGESLEQSLILAGFKVTTLVIPTGETAKSIQQVEILYSKLIQLNCDRSTTLLALGGGVVGDITGFIAATFMRGISYIQIPTTLLAMVDSAIGGKTGVNLPEGKNLVGSIYQPRLVAIDPDVLITLPIRERVSGLAEILKYGAIGDRDFFRFVVSNIPVLLNENPGKLLEKIILRSVSIKAEIVMQDEHEGHLRRILNFGHTIGHALETSLKYDDLKHGEAVAFGMMAAGHISRNRGLLSQGDLDELLGGIAVLPLPEVTIRDEDEILKIIQRDKKVRAGVLHFVLLERLGTAAVVDDVSEAEIRAGLASIKIDKLK